MNQRSDTNGEFPDGRNRHELGAPSDLWLKWLTVLSVLVVVAGFCFAYVFTFLWTGVMQAFYGEITAGELSTLPDSESRYHDLLLAVVGGVMMGWGTMLLLLTRQLRVQGGDWIWAAIAASVAVWFVFDTLGSLLAGSLLNVCFNITFLAAALPPLIANRHRVMRGFFYR